MKGSVFTEFLELVEQKFGMACADRVVTKGCPFHGGYTSVGSYDHQQLIDMVVELSKETQVAPNQLVKAFGHHLFERFFQSYPDAFEGATGTFDLLRRVETVIHVEVQKLTPDAELPRFEFPESSPDALQVVYQSQRPFADLAEGMIEACIVHFGEPLKVHRDDLPGPPGTSAKFTLTQRTGGVPCP